MKYCPHCKKAFDPSRTHGACPTCRIEPPEAIDQDTRTSLVQALHRKANAYGDKRDGAMSFVVLGAIFLVIGLIFFVLSFKPVSVDDNTRVIRPDSLEFVVSMLGICGGGLAFLYGSVRAIVFTRKVRVLHHDIDYINMTLRLDPGPTPLLVSDVYRKTSLRLKNYLKIKKVEREAKRAGKEASKES